MQVPLRLQHLLPLRMPPTRQRQKHASGLASAMFLRHRLVISRFGHGWTDIGKVGLWFTAYNSHHTSIPPRCPSSLSIPTPEPHCVDLQQAPSAASAPAAAPGRRIILMLRHGQCCHEGERDELKELTMHGHKQAEDPCKSGAMVRSLQMLIQWTNRYQ